MLFVFPVVYSYVVVVGVTAVRIVDVTLAGAIVDVEVIVTDGIGSDKQEQAVDKALEAHVCSATGMVQDVDKEAKPECCVDIDAKLALDLPVKKELDDVV